MEEVAVFRAWEQVGQNLIFASQPSFAEVVSHTRLGGGGVCKIQRGNSSCVGVFSGTYVEIKI